jgi:subtilisin family serine protease
MRRISLVQLAKVIDTTCLKAATTLLFGASTLATGCDQVEARNDIEPSSVELRAEPEPEPIEDPNGGSNVIPGHYIVVMQKGANAHAAAAAVKAKPKHVYSSVISGFAGPLNKGQRASLEKRKDVLFIEADQFVTTAETDCAQNPVTCPNTCQDTVTQSKTQGLVYGVDRIDECEVPELSGTYTYYTCDDEEGADVYVFDTGIQTTHSQFAGRAEVAYDVFNGTGQDCHGHGTHVAGIIGGSTYGVAKKAKLYSVRVLDCNGRGSWSDLIEAMEWVKKNAPKPAVVNMSLSGSYSSAVNNAVNSLFASGVVVSVAAGNNDWYACWYSPAAASNALAVAAHNSNDERASFSNFGSCVDIYAAGTNIRSAWLNGTNRTASGTSMASPHVAGVAALYMQALLVDQGGSSPSQIASKIRSDILAWASVGQISGNPAGTPNRQLHYPCSGSLQEEP